MNLKLRITIDEQGTKAEFPNKDPLGNCLFELKNTELWKKYE